LIAVRAAHPPQSRHSSTIGRRAALTRWGVSDNINTARDLEGKFLIGHSGVFLQIREGKPRLAALSVDRSDDLEQARELIASREPVNREDLAAVPD